MIKLHNHRHPAGLECVILKHLPKVILGGIFIPLFMSIFARLLPIVWPIAGSATEIAKHQISIDILAIALCFMVLATAFTVTIGCVIVVLMKGPAYVADAYELEDSEQPDPDDKNNE